MENQEPRSRARLAVSVVLLVIIGASLIAAAYLQTSSTPSTSVSKSQSENSASKTGVSTTNGSSARTSQTSSHSGGGFAYMLSTVLISHFCTNASAIPRSGSATVASSLKFSGSSIGGPYLSELVTNVGSAPILLQAVCVDGAGIGANVTSAELAVSPSNPIQPGQVGNVTVRFNAGTEVYGLPLRSIEFTVIASDGSSASDGMHVCCGLVTEASPTPLISIQSATLGTKSCLGEYPQLSASMNFNGSAAPTILEVDMNGTYVGTVSLHTNYDRFNALLTIGIIDPGLPIRAGAACSFTLVATYPGFITSSATATVVATTSGSPVEVVSVTGPIPPYNPGGPVVSVELENVGDIPITSLNATLPSVPGGPHVPYSFVFNVNSSNPLLPGQSIQETRTLIGASIDSSVEYPLTISGTLMHGTEFSYAVLVHIVPQSSTAQTSTCYSGQLPSNSSSTTKTVSVFNVSAQFNSWQWNGTSFVVGVYTVTAVAHSNTPRLSYLWPQVFLVVSNGQTSQNASFTNLGAWNGQVWPPDFPQAPSSLFNGSVNLQWLFTCDMKVFVEVSIVS
jgi:hypothetical protein